ncbi:MAG: MFS transporter [Proteobacteria bacterium]|nr:MFS transporter [Pseudomonadota bacterium]
MHMITTDFDKRSGLMFILAFGVVSFFADMGYEGMRSSTGPFLALLGASGTVVGVIAGAGELFGYLLRAVSGRLAERTRAYWPFTLAGYVLQMAVIPLLGLCGNWQMAAVVIVLERTGKAIRNPTANFMKSRAGEHIGQGWAFGLHEAMDQAGAMAGPLIVALVLAHHGSYAHAFLWLAVPVALTLISVFTVAARFPYAGHIVAPQPHLSFKLPRAYWLYAASSALVAFGFADYPLIAYHFKQAGLVSDTMIPILYAVAMAASGIGALLFGIAFDKRGFAIFPSAILAAALVTPLAFLGGHDLAIAGAALWGLALGAQNSILSAGVAKIVPEHSRARAYGFFSGIFGIAWFAGSAVMGLLYDKSLYLLVGVSVLAEILALLPLLMAVRSRS